MRKSDALKVVVGDKLLLKDHAPFYVGSKILTVKTVVLTAMDDPIFSESTENDKVRYPIFIFKERGSYGHLYLTYLFIKEIVKTVSMDEFHELTSDAVANNSATAKGISGSNKLKGDIMGD